MQRYIEKYAVTSIVTLNCNGKDHRYTYRYRYYRYRLLYERYYRYFSSLLIKYFLMELVKYWFYQFKCFETSGLNFSKVTSLN